MKLLVLGHRLGVLSSEASVQRPLLFLPSMGLKLCISEKDSGTNPASYNGLMISSQKTSVSPVCGYETIQYKCSNVHWL